MTNGDIVALAHEAMLDVYACMPIAFERGEGPYLFDVEGKRYLDFFCGLAVTSLGHAYPPVVQAVREQVSRLTHVSNVFHTEVAARVAHRLASKFGQGKVFLCNSGAEANEGAIKIARRWGAAHGRRYEIITTENSFHGRTLGTLAATGQTRYREGFEPLPPGFRLVPFDDPEAVRRAVRDETVAVMVEPIQGEGGVVVPRNDGYLAELRKLCDERNLLLIFDEIQTGVGRTGRFFAYEHWNVKPDIVTLAKALGAGLPIGAVVAKAEVASVMTRGSHGSTFGANPVACAASLAVLDALEDGTILANCARVGDYIRQELQALVGVCEPVQEVRGKGMMIGVVLTREARPFAEACLKEGLIVNATAGNVLRLLPPLNLTLDQAAEGLQILRRVLSQTKIEQSG